MIKKKIVGGRGRQLFLIFLAIGTETSKPNTQKAEKFVA
jgi:hypothetical protein